MVGYGSKKMESDRSHYQTLGNGLTDHSSKSRNPIEYAKRASESGDSNSKDGTIPKSALIAPVGFAGGGLIGAAASEGFHKVVSSIPGGLTKIEYGLPFASTTISTGIQSNATYKLVEHSLENFGGNFGFWGLVGVAIAESAYLGYKGIKHAYDWNKNRKIKKQ